MHKITNRKPKAAGQKARNGQQDGKIQELQQEISNLKALLEVMRKEIDALNALVRYLERREAIGKT